MVEVIWFQADYEDIREEETLDPCDEDLPVGAPGGGGEVPAGQAEGRPGGGGQDPAQYCPGAPHGARTGAVVAGHYC